MYTYSTREKQWLKNEKVHVNICVSVESMHINIREVRRKGQASEFAHGKCVCLHVIVSLWHVFGEAAYMRAVD